MIAKRNNYITSEILFRVFAFCISPVSLSTSHSWGSDGRTDRFSEILGVFKPQFKMFVYFLPQFINCFFYVFDEFISFRYIAFPFWSLIARGFIVSRQFLTVRKEMMNTDVFIVLSRPCAFVRVSLSQIHGPSGISAKPAPSASKMPSKVFMTTSNSSRNVS